MKMRTMMKRLFEPVVVVAAGLYFLFDAFVLSILKPLSHQIAKLKGFVVNS
jgi:hypothetical protein